MHKACIFLKSFHEQGRIKNAWTKFGFKKAKALANVKENQIEKKTPTQLKKKCNISKAWKKTS